MRWGAIRGMLMWLVAAAGLALPLLLGGCGSARRGPPIAPEVVPEDPQARRGERQFHRFCYQCHPGGEAGLGPALNDKPLPDVLVKTQVRQGIGAMPAFPAQILSDEDVDAIVAYMKVLRASPGPRELRQEDRQPPPPAPITLHW